jgi:hypothetical protein
MFIKQCKGHWFLSNALFVTLAIMGMMKKIYTHWIVLVLPLKCEEFDQEISILYGKMVEKSTNMICFFLGFAKNFF